MEAPDVAKAKKDLATYLMADYSVTWAIAKVVADYRLFNWKGKGNAWVDDICNVYYGNFNRGDKHQYI
jgi:hypothetical protein